MMARARLSRLKLVYGVALGLHGLFVAGLLALALLGAAMPVPQADAARGGPLLMLLLFFVSLLPGLPSVIALLSWWMCRRRGWVPSSGHMMLTISAIGVMALVLAVGYVT